MKSAVDYIIEQLWAPCRGIPSDIIEEAKRLQCVKWKNYKRNYIVT